MFHPYLNYASYDLQRDNYITIRRLSLFPAYNQVLGLLFGYDESGYGGEADTYFSDVPFLGPLCRISVYFWLLLLMTLYVVLKRLPQACMLLFLCMAFTLTILLSPVIVYRYYCAIVFCMPLLIQFIRRQLAGFRFQQETEAA